MSSFLAKVANRFPGFARTEARVAKPDMSIDELRRVRPICSLSSSAVISLCFII